MKLFLDDFRTPIDAVKYMHQRIGALNPIYLEDWIVVKNYNEFTKFIRLAYIGREEITHVSFDHDLADGHYHKNMQEGVLNYNADDFSVNENKTGYHCAKYLKEVYERLGLKLPVIFIHSMNPVGTENIKNVFLEQLH